jgi:hypothetical protein
MGVDLIAGLLHPHIGGASQQRWNNLFVCEVKTVKIKTKAKAGGVTWG